MELERHNRPFCRKRRKSQEGAVLLMVLLLVVLFTGLGLMAMRHTCAELRSAGAHLDKVQAGLLAEAAISMVATDMRLYFDVGCGGMDSYKNQFPIEFSGIDINALETETRQLKFSSVFDGGDVNCPTPAGQVPGILPDAHIANTVSLAGSTVASVEINHRRPVCAPTDAGNSENSTTAYYWFTVETAASYGAPVPADASEEYEIIQGRAVARARMKIGPVASMGGCGQ